MNDAFLFDKKNFVILIIGLVFIALGFILMTGGGSDDPEVFNPEIFSTTRIAIAPFLILVGFVIEIVAIMMRPKTNQED